jgi:hypothetical protein
MLSQRSFMLRQRSFILRQRSFMLCQRSFILRQRIFMLRQPSSMLSRLNENGGKAGLCRLLIRPKSQLLALNGFRLLIT